MLALLMVFIVWPMLVLGGMAVAYGIALADGGMILGGAIAAGLAWYLMGRVGQRA